MARSFVAAPLTLLPCSVSSAPRPPAAPLPSTDLVYSESFDEAYALAAIDPSVFGDSFNGYCLERTSPTLVPWLIPAVSTDGLAVDAERGAVRFWYRRTDSGLAGASQTARLLTLVSADANTSVEWWSLEASPGAGTISVVSHAGNGPATCLSAAVTLPSDSWVMLVLCYTPTNSALYLGTNLVEVGDGLPPVPGPLLPSTGLVVGSSLSPGSGQIAWGEIDEVATFSGRARRFLRPGFPFGLDPDWDIGAYWAAFAPAAALGAIGPEEEAARQERAAAMLSRRFEAANRLMDQGEQGGPEGGPPPPPCGTNSVYEVWLTNVACALVQTQGWTVAFTIVGGTNGVLYDVFGTAALTNRLTDAYWVWLTNGYACDRLTLTNQWPGGGFYILGLTNDTDGGGLPDAYENLVTHGNIYDPSDDLLTPVVGIQVTDSVALEQQPTNTATFLVSRLGGRLNQPLTIGCQLSGTATQAVDYTISPVYTTATNVLVTILAGQTNIQVTVTPITDTNLEGSETVTLTLTTNVEPCALDPAHTSATAWILEEYMRVYTKVLDFREGVLEGLEAAEPAPDGQLQFKTNLPPQFPFINVACSDYITTPGRGTVVRINTTNGMVVGEYRAAPLGLPNSPNPSRTTVDQYGNVWVANRDDTLAINGTNYGSITRIGLIIGTRYSKTNGVYFQDDKGQYVALSNAIYNTCIDRDGDGYIRTSAGAADILPWNNGGGADSEGGVSTADDEAITEYIRVFCTGTRTIAVDKFNDIWVGGIGGQRTHLKINGLTGMAVPGSAFAPEAGGYGGVIDSVGALWSSPGSGGVPLLRLVPPSSFPVQSTDWEQKMTGDAAVDHEMYGIATDPVHPYIWQTSNQSSKAFRWNTNGTPVTNSNGTLQTFEHGFNLAQGLAVGADGHVWVAHSKDGGYSVGHLNTNGTLVGVVDLRVMGLFAEYFTNTTLEGWPAGANVETGPVDYTSTNWPTSLVTTNEFSVRWSGVVQPVAQGEHVFYVSADAGAAFRLTLNGATIIDNWTSPATNAVELFGTKWLGTNICYGLRLEYAHFTNEGAIRLSWLKPGTTNKEVIPQGRFGPFVRPGPIYLSEGPTGVSVDAAGKIWAACYTSDSATRIDPNAGPMVVITNVVGGVTNVVTNHVGLVDMVVDLGDGSWHQFPYNKPASPYNYSDMTGFNNRVVNPGLKPLKGYWMVVNDSGNAGQLWNRVLWNPEPTNGCSIEVYVRASDYRSDLSLEEFTAVTNNVAFPAIRGRYIEVRLGMTRDEPSKQPVIYDLTLYGVSSGFIGDCFLYDQWADEGSDAVFPVNLIGADPMTYQWFIQYPWMTNMFLVPGATNSTFTITNVDSWLVGTNGTAVSCLVSNGNGESLWLGPAQLEVVPLLIHIPATNYTNGAGPAERYPASINVFGAPTNLAGITVTVWGLSHTRSADLSLLLVSPLGTNVMLMSNVGGTHGVSSASLAFRQGWPLPPVSAAIPSGTTSGYEPSNYGQKTELPGAPSGPYSVTLDDVNGANPNGVWKLYIYDDTLPGGVGELVGSWQLDLSFQ